MEDTGKQTTCALVDEANDTASQSEWDDLALKASEPSLQADLERLAGLVEAERQRKAQMAKTSATLKAAGLALIPTPQQVTLTKGFFDFSADTVVIPDPDHPQARADARMVQGVVNERLGMRLPIGTDGPAGGAGPQLPAQEPEGNVGR